MFRIPDWLHYEIRHKTERLGDWYERLHLRETLNDSPQIAWGMAVLCTLLLGAVFLAVAREAPTRRYPAGKRAWFYDLNTGKLFLADPKSAGPIEAPSGPLPSGEPAGLRAHVYSFVPDPKESELFVGFLERPDPQANTAQLTSNLDDFDAWAQGRLIRRVTDPSWVAPTSVPGQEILRQLTQPNAQGQTPIYHVPK